MHFADGITRLRVGSSGYGARIYDHDVGTACLRDLRAAALEQLTLQCCTVGLGSAATELLDVKSGHLGSVYLRVNALHQLVDVTEGG
jgi:hypothetical protein